MSKFRARWRRARPNRIGPGQLAMVALSPDGTPMHGGWRPFHATQLIGGRTWSLSVIVRGDVAGHRAGSGPVDRALVEEALENLGSDPAAAEATLRRALGR